MINEFKGEYRFLSNFFMTTVVFEGDHYPSSEHAYMAAKTTDATVRMQVARCATPKEAKGMGRKIQLRDGWEGMKQQVMQQILMDKFSRNSIIRQKLLDTGDQQLVEGNWWGDKIWGVCLKTNQGKNLLGHTLMNVRALLKQQTKKLIIAGGRDFKDEALLRDRLSEMLKQGIINDSVELICGMAKGADQLGHDVFQQAGLPISKFIPDWDGLGKRAGFVRNADMGNAADLALIFWDGQSKGTKHMIEYMEKLGKPVYLVGY